MAIGYFRNPLDTILSVHASNFVCDRFTLSVAPELPSVPALTMKNLARSCPGQSFTHALHTI